MAEVAQLIDQYGMPLAGLVLSVWALVTYVREHERRDARREERMAESLEKTSNWTQETLVTALNRNTEAMRDQAESNRAVRRYLSREERN